MVVKIKPPVINAQRARSSHLSWFGMTNTYPPKIRPTTLSKCLRSRFDGITSTASRTWSKLKAEKPVRDINIIMLKVMSHNQNLFCKYLALCCWLIHHSSKRIEKVANAKDQAKAWVLAKSPIQIADGKYELLHNE